MIPSIVSPGRRAAFAATWVSCTAAAFALSGAVFHFSGSPPDVDGFLYPEGLAGAAVNGIATGLLVGGTQRLILRVVHTGSWRWVAGTTLALFLAHVIGDVISDRYAVTILALAGGVLLGALQWWAMPRPRQRGFIWTFATAVTWAAGVWAGYQLGSYVEDWRIEHMLLGTAVGFLTGAATALLWLRCPPRGSEAGGVGTGPAGPVAR